MNTKDYMETFNGKSSGNQAGLITVKSNLTNDEFKLKGRPCELSAFSHVPASRKSVEAIRNPFNYKKEDENYRSNFDQLFDIQYDFDRKTHRDDRRHARLRGLNVWDEEIGKELPTKSSSEIGRHLINVNNSNSNDNVKLKNILYKDNIDPHDRKHVRIMHVKSSFYNRNGLNDLTQADDILFY